MTLKTIQEDYRQRNAGKLDDKTPEICGYYGAACRQIEEDNPNRALCMYCPIAVKWKLEH